MHWLDFILLLTLGVGAVLGAWNGLLWQVARILTFAIAIYACIYSHTPVAAWLSTFIEGGSEVIIKLLSYVVIFLTVYLVCYLITLLLQKGLAASRLKPMDRLLGAAVGVLKALLLSGALLMGFAWYAGPRSDAVLAESKIASVALNSMRAVLVLVPQTYKDQLNSALERIKRVADTEVADPEW